MQFHQFFWSDLVDPLLAETWISGYVDLLRRFRLWTIATEILRLAAPYMMMSPETTSLSQQSTNIRLFTAIENPISYVCLC